MSMPAVAVSEAAPPGADDDRRPLLRHPLPVAVLAAAAGALGFAAYAAVADALIAAFIAVVLVVIAATDIERRLIPNRIVLPAIGIVLVARIAASPGRASEVMLAALAAGAAFLIPNLINSSAMGMGDAKLAIFLGASLGWGVAGAIIVAFLAVFPVALGTFMRNGLAARKATLPFGPFMALGGLVVLIVPHLAGLGGG